MIDPYSFYNPYQQKKRKRARYGSINTQRPNVTGLLGAQQGYTPPQQGYRKPIQRGKVSTKTTPEDEGEGGMGYAANFKQSYDAAKEAHDTIVGLSSEEGRQKLYDKWSAKGEDIGAKLDQFGESLQSGISQTTDFMRNPMGYGKYTEPARYSPGFGPDPQTGFGSEGISMTEGQRLRGVPPSATTGLGIPSKTNQALSQSLGGINTGRYTGNLAKGGSNVLQRGSNLLGGAAKSSQQAAKVASQIGGKGIEQTYRAGAQAGAGAGAQAGTEAGKQASKEGAKQAAKEGVTGLSSSTIGTGVAMAGIALEVAQGETQDKLTGSHEVDTGVRLVAAYYTAGWSELLYAFI